MLFNNKALYWWIGGIGAMLLVNHFVGTTTFVPFIAFAGFAAPRAASRAPAGLPVR